MEHDEKLPQLVKKPTKEREIPPPVKKIPPAGILILILIFTAVAAAIYIYPTEERIFPTTDQSKNIDINGKEFIYWPKNFSFEISPDWGAISPIGLNLPKHVNRADFALKKNSSSCIFAYVEASAEFWKEYAQASFAERVFTADDEQIDGSWYVYKDNLPPNYEFQSERQFLNHEIRLAAFPSYSADSDYSNFDSFILFSADGNSVSASCDKDVSTMLASLESKYDLANLGENSNGILYLATSKNNSETGLFLKSDEDNISRKIFDIDTWPFSKILFRDNNLFYVSKGGNLEMLELPSGSKTVIIPAQGEFGVDDYHIWKNRIFYLFGYNCKSSPTCIELYEYDLVTKQNISLENRVTFGQNFGDRAIVGYDDVENVLYLQTSYGDAGCFSANTSWFDFDLNKFIKGESYGACVDDPDYLEQETKIHAFLERTRDQIFYENFISVQNGKFYPPRIEDSSVPSNWAPIGIIKSV